MRESLHKKSLYSELFWSAFSPDFPAFGLNTERYSVRMWENPGKMQTRITPNMDSFYAVNVIKLRESKYRNDIYNKCTTGKSDWICKSCHNFMTNNKTPMHAQLNNTELCPKFSEFDRLCPVEFRFTSQIIPFMFVVAKAKVAQHGRKGQCVLVPTDLKKI